MVLPGDARAASVPHSNRTWIVGGRPGPVTTRLAARYRGTPVVADAGIYAVPLGAARPFAGELAAAGLLTLAEPDAIARKSAFPQDPLSQFAWWDTAVVDPSLTPPPVTSSSPLLGVIEEEIERNHGDMGPNIQQTRNNPPPDEHGTAVAGSAGAPFNNFGIVGIWPGMRILIPIPNVFNCSNNARSVDRAVSAGARVINMSYGFVGRSACFSHLIATQKAFGKGRVLVAAAGNEFQEGNPLESPGADPHVITAAALNQDLTASYFSNRSGAIDVAAPGKGILLPVSFQHDDDGTRDGFKLMDGTSFSSPMVAAVASWLLAVRPGLGPGQVQDILAISADDLGPRGYDRTFGWGKVNLRDALATRTPPNDPLEPNDDIVWINGTYFRTDPPIFGPSTATRNVFAALDGFEDPYDVYRAIVPARRSVRFRIYPQFGDPDLDLYSTRARSVTQNTGLLGRSRRSGRKTDTVIFTNRGRRATTVLVNPYVPEGAAVNAAYRLEVKKVAFRG
jgi:subtilase family protein